MKALNRQQVVNSQLSPSDIVLTLSFRVQSSGKILSVSKGRFVYQYMW